MALAVINLTATMNTADAVSYAMPAVNVDKDSLLLFTIVNSLVGVPDNAVITGLTGATWAAIENVTIPTTATANTRHAVWRTMVGTSANTVTLTASFGGVTQTGFVGILDLVTGCATSGADGAGAVTQSTFTTTSASANMTITLPSVPTQAVYGSYSKILNTNMGTPTGFTETGDLGIATPARRAMAAFNLTPTQTWTSTQPATATLSVIGMEFALQTTGAPGTTPSPRTRLLLGVGL